MPKPKITKEVMSQIKSGKLKMKPRWYFILGSLLLFTGLVGILIGVIFLTNIAFFLNRRQGFVNSWRFEYLLTSFPLWVPLTALIGVIVGLYLLKRYDFSYRKNFSLIAILIILAILLASYSLDTLGLNQSWSTHTPMRKFYQQLDRPSQQLPSSQQGQGSVKGIHKRAIFN